MGVYSLGQLLASPVFGVWSDFQHAMFPLQTGLVLTVVFNLTYCYAAIFSSTTGKYIMLISRALVGAGAGMQVIYIHIKFLLHKIYVKILGTKIPL